ncbi:cactus-binding C-terminus of cactin protein-domain-containing protein [Lipomyces chichibuensis]|uniref:cactus-binding C-terminus of cactin protein-domain-containing protein n=1 Tax=Lipomyces chichibuensis TaxID=1546026 RepID=UPI0033433312
MSSEYHPHSDRYYPSDRNDYHGSSRSHHHNSSGRRRSRSPSTTQERPKDESRSRRSLPRESSDRRREDNKSYERRRYDGDYRPPRGQISQEEEKQLQEWVAGEDAFALRQAKKGAIIRVKENRARPVDWLAINLRAVDEDKDVYDGDLLDGLEIEIPVPYTVIEGLDLAEIQKLESDIGNYLKLEKKGSNHEFWEAMMIICKDTKEQLRDGGKAHDSATHAVSEDIENILRDKDYDDLVGLEDRIEILLSGDSAVDVEFWSELKKELLIRKAKEKIKRVHELVIRGRVKLLAQQQEIVAKEAISQIQSCRSDASLSGAASIQYATVMDEIPQSEVESISSHQRLDGIQCEEFISRLTQEQQMMERVGLVPLKHNARSRQKIKGPGNLPGTENATALSEKLFEKEVAKGTNDNEEVFNDEEDLDAADEYKEKLKKPKYFNRVQMGFDWNKYNQTHYNQDNPPPKVVQGYKFNIFYPELIDSAKAPTYKIVREGGRRRGQSFASPGESDTCVIKFIAGPPYHDLAFRIVDREWDYSSRRENGFRSSFDKGILQLHFRFKKIFYRK